MLIPWTWFCAWCGPPCPSEVDASQGRRQTYVEDCQVCCRPNVLDLSVDPESGEVEGAAAPESS